MSIIKLKNNALDNLTSFEGSASLGDMVLVSSATASSSASIEFSLGSYKEYKFFFVNIHAGTSAVDFTFQTSIDGGSTYGVTATSTAFRAYHEESDINSGLGYITDDDLAQSTSFQVLSPVGGATALGTDNDSNLNGTLQLFNPSSNTFVKHFIARTAFFDRFATSSAVDGYISGYFNDTNDLTNIKFQMSSGNIDDGKILLFGLN
jgi:hypothetical protein